jgi:hemerythrin-like metal-binding protein
MGIAWAKHMSVGNAMVDAEHKNLFTLVNMVKHAIEIGDRPAMSKSFELLVTYIRIHFTNENKIAKAVNCLSVENKLNQKYSMDELSNIVKKLETTKGVWSNDFVKMYSGYMGEWIRNHIIMDMYLKPKLKDFPYDFKPD